MSQKSFFRTSSKNRVQDALRQLEKIQDTVKDKENINISQYSEKVCDAAERIPQYSNILKSFVNAILNIFTKLLFIGNTKFFHEDTAKQQAEELEMLSSQLK